MNDAMEKIAKVAYHAYGNSVGWRAYNGQPMMTWDELPDHVREAWAAAAAAVRQDDEIWAKLTEDNVACTCCSSDYEYISRVNEVGALMDGREWVQDYDPETRKTTYHTVKP